ncbi:MAG: hypothetical protein SFW07_05360 [Gammaproteobacteria bacterium]|nr:hypothetical protein [Gammaproteobacteria bacterium]
MATVKSSKTKKVTTATSRTSKADIKKATKKAMAQYGNALRNLANR